MKGHTNFLISVQRQENHSWQGTIQWLDSGKTVHFRSELEMLALMDEAVKQSGEAEEKRSWDEANTIQVVKGL
ncbi:hypothetical protein ACR6HW_11110 [Fusibacter sp. JL298sf-3]